jgi:hypothetical protein
MVNFQFKHKQIQQSNSRGYVVEKHKWQNPQPGSYGNIWVRALLNSKYMEHHNAKKLRN